MTAGQIIRLMEALPRGREVVVLDSNADPLVINGLFLPKNEDEAAQLSTEEE